MAETSKIDLDRVSAKLGSVVRLLAAPGGLDRKTVVCMYEGRQVVVSQRRSVSRAQMEAEILRRLAPTGMVPKLVRVVDDVLVQEYVAGARLPVALETAAEPLQRQMIHRGANTLLALQRAAVDVGLGDIVPEIGARAGWAEDLAMSPARLGQAVGLTVPGYDFGELLGSGDTTAQGFIKWDARPGNMLIRPDGTVCVFDWEHAGRRRFVDDLAWFFADEWMPDAPDTQSAVLQELAGNDSSGQVQQQFAAMAVAHSCIRLHLILLRKGTGGWWNRAACLQKDRVGVTQRNFTRVSEKAAGWSKTVEKLKPLAVFFEKIRDLVVGK